MTDKAQFFWAIIGDSAPEPVAVTGKDGERLAYTIGCPDPFKVDGPDANIQLIHNPNQTLRGYDGDPPVWSDEHPPRAMVIPKTPKQREAERVAAEARLEADRKKGIRHGYAGFGRAAS